jgi:hypothetical protein
MLARSAALALLFVRQRQSVFRLNSIGISFINPKDEGLPHGSPFFVLKLGW